MHEKYSTALTGMYVTYYGSNPEWWGQEFEILDESKSSDSKPKRIAFMADGKLQWRTLGNSFSNPHPYMEGKKVETTTYAKSEGHDFKEFNQVASNFLEPHQDTIAALDEEAKRLRERLAEIEVAKKVLKSL